MCRLVIYKGECRPERVVLSRALSRKHGTEPVLFVPCQSQHISQHQSLTSVAADSTAHSIINQSYDSRLRVDRRRPINGDGFGVGGSSLYVVKVCTLTGVKAGWSSVLPLDRSVAEITPSRYDSVYDPELGTQPCIFTSVTPVSSTCLRG